MHPDTHPTAFFGIDFYWGIGCFARDPFRRRRYPMVLERSQVTEPLLDYLQQGGPVVVQQMESCTAEGSSHFFASV